MNRFRTIPAFARPAMVAVLLAGALGGCRPEPPPAEQRPEPQAATEMRDAIQAPQQEAAATEQAVLDAAQQQRGQIEAAEGG